MCHHQLLGKKRAGRETFNFCVCMHKSCILASNIVHSSGEGYMSWSCIPFLSACYYEKLPVFLFHVFMCLGVNLAFIDINQTVD